KNSGKSGQSGRNLRANPLKPEMPRRKDGKSEPRGASSQSAWVSLNAANSRAAPNYLLMRVFREQNKQFPPAARRRSASTFSRREDVLRTIAASTAAHCPHRF